MMVWHLPKMAFIKFSIFFCFSTNLSGNYAGFDESEPTCQQNGKAKVVAYLKNRYKYRYITIVGDGVTDLEACPPAVSFFLYLKQMNYNTFNDSCKHIIGIRMRS